MSQEQLKAFMQKVKEDKELQEKIISLATEHGFNVEHKDFADSSVELDDSSLDNVAGGGTVMF